MRGQRLGAVIRAEKILTEMIARYGEATPLGLEHISWLHQRIAQELSR
jgi:hypothetical protein